MAWRKAKSIEKLRAQIDAAAPRRDISADGTIGDAAHASRNSDHNPWVKDGNVGVVRAIDVTHDPDDGVDAGAIADAIRISADPRVDYIISNKRIANSGGPWRKYSGSNPHNHHFHVSVDTSKALYDDTRDWQIGMIKAPLIDRAIAAVKKAVVGPKITYPTLKRGSKGADVRKLQDLLKIKADGQFGPVTEKAVREVQRRQGLKEDGIAGLYTWKAIGG
jgi:peptidoglycan hydrolase-like protein with peptidoglycan-binding domain